MTTETITWRSAADALPDDAETVMIAMPDHSEPEPVWLGWYDSEHGRWINVDGCPIATTVTHWARMPEGPTEC